MNEKQIDSDEVESIAGHVSRRFVQRYETQLEGRLLELIFQSRSDRERYFACLSYGEMLLKMGRWDEARDSFTRSAQIAVRRKDDLWLALSHEKLGDLSAAEENWFGAVHHYRYAMRKAASVLDRPAMEKLDARANAARNALHSTLLLEDAAVIPLSKEYVSSNVAISFVHRDIFLKQYFARCLECNFCHDWCCSFGADIDIRNVKKIQQHKEEILAFIRPSEGEWFEAEYAYYEEYAGGQYTRINTQGPRCVFISKDQRGCGLHRYAISKQMDYHEIKPLVCVLFPLSFGEGILSLAPELEDDSLICTGTGYSAYHSIRSELQHYFGREFVEELASIQKNVLGKSDSFESVDLASGETS